MVIVCILGGLFIVGFILGCVAWWLSLAVAFPLLALDLATWNVGNVNNTPFSDAVIGGVVLTSCAVFGGVMGAWFKKLRHAATDEGRQRENISRRVSGLLFCALMAFCAFLMALPLLPFTLVGRFTLSKGWIIPSCGVAAGAVVLAVCIRRLYTGPGTTEGKSHRWMGRYKGTAEVPELETFQSNRKETWPEQ